MALTEDTIVDSIDVLPDGQIQVRRATRVFRDGEEISKSFHRHVVSPGDDLSKEDPRVKLPRSDSIKRAKCGIIYKGTKVKEG